MQIASGKGKWQEFDAVMYVHSITNSIFTMQSVFSKHTYAAAVAVTVNMSHHQSKLNRDLNWQSNPVSVRYENSCSMVKIYGRFVEIGCAYVICCARMDG